MALSTTPTLACDFTASLVPQVGAALGTWVLSDGATRDNTDGITTNTTNGRAELSCASGGDLTNWAYPFTIISVLLIPSAATEASHRWVGARLDSGGATMLGTRIRPSDGDLILNNTGYTLNFFGSMTLDAEKVIVSTLRSTGVEIWEGTTSLGSNTSQSLTIATLNTSDYLLIGGRPSSGEAGDYRVRGYALVPGELNGTDRTNLVANWRTELGVGGGGGSSIAAISSGYHTRNINR